MDFSSVASGDAKKSTLPMKSAIQRRIQKNQGEPGGGPVGGKKYLAPMNNKRAGSMITPNKHKGVYSTFVNEKFNQRKYSTGR